MAATNTIHRPDFKWWLSFAAFLRVVSSIGDPDILNLDNFPRSQIYESPFNLSDPLFCNTVPVYEPPPIYDVRFAPFDADTAIIYRYRKQHSVNLGSWFVHEKWMTPSVFRCASGNNVSELDIASGWGTPLGARGVLERHWDTFITRADFVYLASIGINTVRLPIGYWSLGEKFCKNTQFEPVSAVYRNSWPRIRRAISWAAAAGIGVLVDLHGSVGSQNGQPHSGVSDGKVALFSEENMAKTISILRFLANELSCVNNVVGLQLLNEPSDGFSLRSFYTRALNSVKGPCPLPLYIHDAFNLNAFSQVFSSASGPVTVDHHSYFVFTPSDKAKSASDLTGDIETYVASSLEAAAASCRNLIIGEWSCALTSDSLASEWDSDEARRIFCQAQLSIYEEMTSGWSFWSYMTEDCEQNAGWCFRAAVGQSLPRSFFPYGEKTFGISTSQVMNLDPQAPAGYDPVFIQGYLDGCDTAKKFAIQGWQRLGFVEQYITDKLVAIRKSSLSLDEARYRSGFRQGLKDAEEMILSLFEL